MCICNSIPNHRPSLILNNTNVVSNRKGTTKNHNNPCYVSNDDYSSPKQLHSLLLNNINVVSDRKEATKNNDNPCDISKDDRIVPSNTRSLLLNHIDVVSDRKETTKNTDDPYEVSKDDYVSTKTKSEEGSSLCVTKDFSFDTKVVDTSVLETEIVLDLALEKFHDFYNETEIIRSKLALDRFNPTFYEYDCMDEQNLETIFTYNSSDIRRLEAQFEIDGHEMQETKISEFECSRLGIKLSGRKMFALVFLLSLVLIAFAVGVVAKRPSTPILSTFRGTDPVEIPSMAPVSVPSPSHHRYPSLSPSLVNTPFPVRSPSLSPTAMPKLSPTMPPSPVRKVGFFQNILRELLDSRSCVIGVEC
uniref:Uncharacterized protein n=1 Tax=Corethron hystrix TaxID=216773 RepID=A0A7S1BMC8_9STRA|mmetsp:Transcript_31975/g.73548  ORF Transcript_31975/g.73548 Transcript_31975/m.73548 type:complete len:361 (+) Transcript_31975:206-1288(+)